jgi:hypothetical protein
MKTTLITLVLMLLSQLGYSVEVEEVKYQRLQATPERYLNKSIIINCEIRKLVTDRKILDADCDKEQTGGPCIYKNNNWICLKVSDNKKAMIDYFIDTLEPGTISKAKIKGRLINSKVFEIEEVRFCNDQTMKCEPYKKVVN